MISDSELSEFDFTAKELYLTLDKFPELTDEEIFVKFPEFNDNPDVLNQSKIKAMEFGGEPLKKRRDYRFRRFFRRIRRLRIRNPFYFGI